MWLVRIINWSALCASSTCVSLFVQHLQRTNDASCDPALPSHVAPRSFAFSINVSGTLLGRVDGCCNLIWYTFAELHKILWKQQKPVPSLRSSYERRALFYYKIVILIYDVFYYIIPLQLQLNIKTNWPILY